MTKKKSNKNKKQPWSIPLRAREELYNGINPSAGFGIGSFLSQGLGYLGGFRTGKGMSEDEARWAAYLGLPYDKEYAPDTKIRFEHDKDYPDRQYQGVSKRAKNEIREEVIPEAKRIKDEYGKEWIQVLDERGIFGNDSTIYHPRETYTGDLGKFGIREVGNSGIYEIGDKYDFPSWVPVPDRNKGTELMIRDTIWSDRANPKLYNKEIIKRKKKFYDGGLKVDMPNFKGTQLTSNISTKTPLSYGQSFKVGAANAWNNVKTGQANGALNTAATAVGGLLAGKNKTKVGTALQGLGSLASNIPGVGGMIGAGVNLVGGLVNAAFGSNINKEFVNQVEAQARQQSNYVSGATDNTSLMSDWEALAFLGDVKKSDVGSEGWFSNKATNETARLNTLTDEANMRALASISNTAENIDEQNDLLLQANYSAYGGKLNKFDNGGFANFINSDSFNGIGDSLMGFSYTTGGEDQYIQNSLGRNHGSGYYGVASKAGMATYDIINGIRNLTKSKRTPIENKIGLYANGGNINKYAGIVESGAKLIGNAVNEANNMVDIKPIQKQVRQFGNTNFGGTNDDLLKQWGNTSFLSPNVTTRDIRNKSYFDDFMTSVPASFEGFNAGSSFGPIGAAAGAIIGGASSLVGSFIGRNKAEKRAKRLNESITRSNERVRNNFNLAVENNNKDMLFNMMKNYSAYGGPISGALDYEYYNNITNNDKLGILGNMKFTSLPNSFSNVEMQELKTFADGGKIYIKPSKRGTFTAAAKKRGMGVQEFASKVLANKEDYSPAMVKKANFARNASKWKHADGGPLEEENLSLEDFITQKINEKRAAALDKSRNRTSVRVPMVPNQKTEEQWRNRINDNIRYQEERLSRIMSDYDAYKNRFGIGFFQEEQEALDKLLEEKDKGYPKLVSGSNCMYNAGDCYGLNIPGNQTFTAKHKEKGFKRVDSSNMEPGDIVQDNRTGIPIHAMIYDSKDSEGNLRFNYARGSSTGDIDADYVRQGEYPLPLEDYATYRFVGTPADSTQWINEYKEMYNNKKAEGGNLFTNGVITIGNGGTHEQNPYEGVQMGVDPQGIPNLVEEGEVIYDDYVFSNRLRVPKEVRQKYKLSGVTFADAAKQLQKESEERPNDSISKNGLNAAMTMLQQEQEAIRMKKESNKYAKGGKLGRVYDGTGGDPNWLYRPVTPGFIPSKEDILAEMEAMYPSLLEESTLPIASKIEGSTAFEKEQSSKVAPMKTNWLRYVPIVGSGLAVANDLFGGNEPDYTNADMFARAIEGTNRPIRGRQIGNYLTYRPFDRNYYINTLNANTAAARRAAVNTSGGNRAAALAGMLAADYNYGNQLGALARQAEEYNLAQRQAVEEFNRGTNMTNAEMAMKADMANAEQAMQRARMYGSLAEYRDKILAANRAEKSANLTNFIQGLGNLGTELTDKDKLRWLAELGVLTYDASGKYTGDKKSNVGAKGGRINRKKRGGFTI